MSKQIEATASELAALESEEKELSAKLLKASLGADANLIVQLRTRGAELPLHILAARLRLERLHFDEMRPLIGTMDERTGVLKRKFEGARKRFEDAREAKEDAFKEFHKSDNELQIARRKGEALQNRIEQLENILLPPNGRPLEPSSPVKADPVSKLDPNAMVGVWS